MLNKAEALFNCFKVTPGGANVTQNFLVVSKETKQDAFNHNPSGLVAMETKASHVCPIHSKGC
jgi:hypothetical protein